MPITTPTTENCHYYARFMSGLGLTEAEGLYWGMFTFLLMLLFTASWKFGRTTERIEEIGSRDRERGRQLKHCFWFCAALGLVALIVVVLEAFVIMALQFCAGEPIVSVYWATWTMLQVGGLIAIWGICLHVRHMITGKKHPPWALALGTPVLVVAGLGHYFQGKLKRSRAARSIKERSRSRGRLSVAISEVPTFREYSSDRNAVDSDGQSPTIRGDEPGEYNAKVVGYTKNGDIIIRLAPETKEDFTSQVQLSSSITWDEPTRPASTLIEGNSSRRHSRARGQSISSVKGKEKQGADAARNGHDEEVGPTDTGDHGKEEPAKLEEV